MSNISSLLCKPRAFKLQKHQLFLKRKSHLNRLLLFHGIGSGKTCSAISMAASYYTKYDSNKKIIVIVPASLRENFLKELKGPCGNQVNHDKSIFDVMSYQGFIKRYNNNTIDIDNTLVIIDEVQNIISQTGNMYRIFLEAFQNMQNSNLICLSATPMFDKPIEIALLGNLLLTKTEFDQFHLPTNPVAFSKMMGTNPKILYTFFKKKISYFAGADQRAYPTKTEHRVDCVMSPFQRQVYMESIGHIDMQNIDKHLQRAFLIAPRQLSNIVLSNGNVGKLKDIDPSFDVKKYSTKFYKCIKNIKKSPGPVFVYSNFVSVSGTDAFALILSKVYGFKQLRKNEAGTTPKPRFGIFRANKPDENARLLQLFNSPQNKDGSLIKIIIGSPTMKEGVTLLRVRQIHLIDPYWNRSRTEQIMGRGVRFCSHADLPVEQRKVDIFHYYAIPSDKDVELSVDLRILQLSNDKIRRINIIETILKETSIDCKRTNNPDVHCFQHKLVSAAERQHLLSFPKNMDQYNAKEQTQSKVVPLTTTNKPGGNNNATNNITSQPTTISQPKSKPKPLQFGKQSAKHRQARKKVPNSTCPSNRRPNDQNECSENFPHLRKNTKGDFCCYKRPSKDQTTATTTKRTRKPCKPNQILNPATKRCVLLTSKLGKQLLKGKQPIVLNR